MTTTNPPKLEPPSLTYEAPLFAETRGLPRIVNWTVVPFFYLIAIGEITAFNWLLSQARISMKVGSIWLAAIALLLLMPLIFTTLRGTVLVYADRMELLMRIAGRRVWARRIPWAQVENCDVARGWRWGVLSFGPRKTFFMFTGTGMHLTLARGKQLYVGAADKDAFLAAVAQALKAWPALEKRGSPGPNRSL